MHLQMFPARATPKSADNAAILHWSTLTGVLLHALCCLTCCFCLCCLLLLLPCAHRHCRMMRRLLLPRLPAEHGCCAATAVLIFAGNGYCLAELCALLGCDAGISWCAASLCITHVQLYVLQAVCIVCASSSCVKALPLVLCTAVKAVKFLLCTLANSFVKCPSKVR